MDGTIVEFGSHTISERVIDSIVDCENQGVKVTAVTGRPFSMAQKALQLLKFKDPCVFDNGASIQFPNTGEFLWQKWLEPDVLQEAAGLIYPHASIINYTPEEDDHTPADNEGERIRQISVAAPSIFAIIQMDKSDEINAALTEIPDITYYNGALIHSMPGYIGIQVNHRLADKFHGVHALRDITGIAKENTLAIGDGRNDLALGANSGFMVAMGNAEPELIAVADYVTGTLAEDGFAQAMDRFVLARVY